jgi:hypothetical protein
VTRVFISYRRDDTAAQAGRIYDRLTGEFGDDQVFMDVDAIPLGRDFIKVLGDEVAKCDALLAMIRPNWLDARDEDGSRRLDDPDDFVRTEIAAALQRDIPVIPILVDGGRVPKSDQLPSDLKKLARRQVLEVRNASFRSDVDKLIRGLKAEPPRRRPLRPSRPSEGVSKSSKTSSNPIEDVDPLRGLRRELIQSVIGSIVGIFVACLYPTFLITVFPSRVRVDLILPVLMFLFVASAVPTLFWRKTLITAVHGFASYGTAAFIASVFYLLCAFLYSVYIEQSLFPLGQHPNTFLLGVVVAEAPVALLLILRRRHQRAMTVQLVGRATL